MSYSFDQYGWLSDGRLHGRETSAEPPAHNAIRAIGEQWPNWTGVVWDMAVYTLPPPANLADLKVAKIAAIRRYFDAMVGALKADAAPYEVETWDRQALEYSAWAANNGSNTPYVTALAAARGITLAALMGKIGIKVAGLATIQGMQQALEDAVKAATTEAQLQEITL
jgi:hypothetical protein